MFSKVLRYGLYGTLGATSSIFILENQDSQITNSIGAVRFGRAALTVNLKLK